MTFSPNARGENCAFALRLMFERVADQAVDEVFFSPHEFPEILPTTWEEIESFKLISKVPITGEICMTGIGWIGALIVTKERSEKKFTERLERRMPVNS